MVDKRAGAVLFPNKKKSGPNAPDYTGKVTLDEDLITFIQATFDKTGDMVELDLAGWKKTSSNGSTFLSLAVKPPRERQREDAPF